VFSRLDSAANPSAAIKPFFIKQVVFQDKKIIFVFLQVKFYATQ